MRAGEGAGRGLWSLWLFFRRFNFRFGFLARMFIMAWKGGLEGFEWFEMDLVLPFGKGDGMEWEWGCIAAKGGNSGGSHVRFFI